VTYLTYADFRTASIAEYCLGIDLTSTEASDALMTAAIARMSQRFNDYTDDVFEPESLTLELDGEGTARLLLPKRCTSVTTLKLRDSSGTLGSAEAAAAYRLHSSLYASGSKRMGEWDFLEVVPGGSGLSDGTYVFPEGPQTCQIVGSFGWTTTPGDVKRAVALMVYDHFKGVRADIRAAESVSANNVIVRYAQPDPANGIWTGINECDAIIRDYQRRFVPAVG
jgi:hypothetical protein